MNREMIDKYLAACAAAGETNGYLLELRRETLLQFAEFCEKQEKVMAEQARLYLQGLRMGGEHELS